MKKFEREMTQKKAMQDEIIKLKADLRLAQSNLKYYTDEDSLSVKTITDMSNQLRKAKDLISKYEYTLSNINNLMSTHQNSNVYASHTFKYSDPL